MACVATTLSSHIAQVVHSRFNFNKKQIPKCKLYLNYFSIPLLNSAVLMILFPLEMGLSCTSSDIVIACGSQFNLLQYMVCPVTTFCTLNVEFGCELTGCGQLDYMILVIPLQPSCLCPQDCILLVVFLFFFLQLSQ